MLFKAQLSKSKATVPRTQSGDRNGEKKTWRKNLFTEDICLYLQHGCKNNSVRHKPNQYALKCLTAAPEWTTKSHCHLLFYDFSNRDWTSCCHKHDIIKLRQQIWSLSVHDSVCVCVFGPCEVSLTYTRLLWRVSQWHYTLQKMIFLLRISVRFSITNIQTFLSKMPKDIKSCFLKKLSELSKFMLKTSNNYLL